MILAHMHEPGCKCSRCAMRRNYARLRATVTDGPEADAVKPSAAQLGIPLAEPVRRDLDVVGHA